MGHRVMLAVVVSVLVARAVGATDVLMPGKVAIIKDGALLKIVAKPATTTFPLAGEAGVVLTSGADRYCAEFGGTTLRNDAGFVKRKDAPAPASCPSTTTTTNSTCTTTTTFPPCQMGFGGQCGGACPGDMFGST